MGCTSELGGNWLMKKHWSRKSRGTVPLKEKNKPQNCRYVGFLKVHKRKKFFSSDFEFFTILYLVKLKY
jgi:hypothetical protein